MTKTVLILNGPGLADTPHYRDRHGRATTLADIEAECAALGTKLGLELDFRQTNDQDEMFRWIAKDSEHFDGVIINPVGHSRASIQVFELYRSAIQMIANFKKPIIEVHISNIYQQVDEITQPAHEPVGDMGFICGFGKHSYLLALRAIAHKLEQNPVKRLTATDSQLERCVYVLNGPNLNLLGRREPEIYGHQTLDDIARRCQEVGADHGLKIVFRQSNHEGVIVDWIQEAIESADAIVINAAAYTHTSVAIHDALRVYPGCIVELHISNPHLRESFRHVSYVSTAADAIVAGLGVVGYELVLEIVKNLLDERD